eukprot:scaffold699_cov385-Prasinococcus_capsulatus_cf.AAC.39
MPPVRLTLVSTSLPAGLLPLCLEALPMARGGSAIGLRSEQPLSSQLGSCRARGDRPLAAAPVERARIVPWPPASRWRPGGVAPWCWHPRTHRTPGGVARHRLAADCVRGCRAAALVAATATTTTAAPASLASPPPSYSTPSAASRRPGRGEGERRHARNQRRRAGRSAKGRRPAALTPRDATRRAAPRGG